MFQFYYQLIGFRKIFFYQTDLARPESQISGSPECWINEVCLASWHCHQITKSKNKNSQSVARTSEFELAKKEWHFKTELPKFVHLFHFNKLREKNLNIKKTYGS